METTQANSAAGRIADKSVAQLFVEWLRQRASGALTLKNEATVRVIHFQAGMIRFAESNVKSESAGQMQVAAGLIKQASFDRAVALARQQNVALHEALASARVLSPDQLRSALKQQTVDVAVGGLLLEEGFYGFASRSAEMQNGLPDSRVSPVALVLEWARRVARTPKMRAWLEQRGTFKVLRSAELEREMFAVKATWPGESVTPGASSGKTIGDLLPRVKEAELPLFYALCVSGLFSLVMTNAGIERKQELLTAAAEDKAKVFTKKEHEARRMIFAEAERTKDSNHYEVLEVPQAATTDQIRAAYYGLARKFHSDAFSSMELGSARRISEELFQKINEANQTLSNEQTRSEYDVYVDRKAKGLPTDVGAILKAESIFQKGELLFNAGKFEDAETLFREAIGLNHAEAEFHAYLGMAVLRRRGKPPEAMAHIQKALELDPRLKSAQVFLSAVQHANGEEDVARKTLRKLLTDDPDNALAKAEQARQRAKAQEPAKKSFFGGLFKK